MNDDLIVLLIFHTKLLAEMLVKCKLVEFDKWLFLEEVQDQFLPYKSYQRNQTKLLTGPLKSQQTWVNGHGLFIWSSRISVDKAVHFHTETIGQAISILIFQPLNESMAFAYESCLDGQANNRKFSSLHYLNRNKECDFLFISLSKSFFKNLIERDERLRLDFLKRQSLENSKSSSQYFADSAFQNISRELSNMISSDTLDRNLLDELLINIFHENYQNIEVANSHGLEVASQIDINKLEKAKRVLEGNIMHPPTQKELAEEVLMSESKLRKDFKKYYGITIHDFLTQIRMQKARIYLLVDQLTVYEVASLTGYGHQNNFSYAFRKFFGYPPRDLKV